MVLKRSIQAPSDAPFQISLGPARFYLDDIRDVHNALLDFSRKYLKETGKDGPEAVEIRAASAIADDIEDLKEATRAELDNVTLVLLEPKIRVDLKNLSAKMIAGTDTDMISSFTESMAKFVNGRRSWRAPFQWPFVLSLVPLYLLTAGSYLIPYTPKAWGLYINHGVGNYDLALSIFFTFATLGMTAYLAFLRRNTVKVIPLWRRERRTISRETRTAIIAGVLSAVALGLLGFWAGIFVKK